MSGEQRGDMHHAAVARHELAEERGCDAGEVSCRDVGARLAGFWGDDSLDRLEARAKTALVAAVEHRVLEGAR